MVEVFKNVNMTGSESATIYRDFRAPDAGRPWLGGGASVESGGTEAFNLGVDFKGGTVVTAQFKQRPPAEAIRDALTTVGSTNAVIQPGPTKLTLC